MDCQRFSTLSPSFVHCPDFPAGISVVKPIEPVFDPSKTIVHSVGCNDVKVIIDGDEPRLVLGNGDVDIHICHSGVADKPRFDADMTTVIYKKVLKHRPSFLFYFSCGTGFSDLWDKMGLLTKSPFAII